MSEAAHAGWTIVEQYVGPGGTPLDVSGAVHDLAEGVLERVATTEHPQPLLGLVEMRHSNPDLLDDAGFVLVGDSIGDPGNAGTMVRSAEAAGADAVVLCGESVDVFNPKVIRASAGAIFHIPVVTGIELAAVKACGLTILATSSHEGTSMYDTDMTGRTALLMGNEAHGIREDSSVDAWVTIPQYGQSESLNVAMATTVLCFEIARQRRLLNRP